MAVKMMMTQVDQSVHEMPGMHAFLSMLCCCSTMGITTHTALLHALLQQHNAYCMDLFSCIHSKEALWPYVREFADRAISHIDGMLQQLRANMTPCELYAVHGHYADAGEAAALISSTMDADMLMTGHSLGRNKLEHLRASGRKWQDCCYLRWRWWCGLLASVLVAMGLVFFK